MIFPFCWSAKESLDGIILKEKLWVVDNDLLAVQVAANDRLVERVAASLVLSVHIKRSFRQHLLVSVPSFHNYITGRIRTLPSCQDKAELASFGTATVTVVR